MNEEGASGLRSRPRGLKLATAVSGEGAGEIKNYDVNQNRDRQGERDDDQYNSNARIIEAGIYQSSRRR
jgi:hypothetical protein